MDRRTFLLAAAAQAPLLAGRPALAAARPARALVTADLESHVAVVDLRAGRVVRRVRTAPGPRAVEAVAVGRAVVVHTEAGVLSLLDARRGRVERVVRGFDVPRYAVCDVGGRWAFVTDGGRGEVVVLDLWRGRVARRVAVGAGARHLTLRRDVLWVALGNAARELAAVDVSDPLRPRLLRRRVQLPFRAHDVGLSPSGRRLWVTSGDGRRLAVYSARGGEPQVVLGAGAPPQHVTFAGAVALVTSGDSATLRAHALDDGRLLREAAIPAGSFNVQRGGGAVLTPSLSSGTLTVADHRGRVRRRIRVARAAHDACGVT